MITGLITGVFDVFRKRSVKPYRRAYLVAASGLVAAVAIACGSGAPVTGSESLADTFTGGQQPAERTTEPAPQFSAETFHHGVYDLGENIGRPVLINFWFPSCPPCRAEMPDLQAAYEKYGEEVDFVGVQQTSLDTPEEAIAFLDELGVTYPNFADNQGGKLSEVQIAFRILSFPTTVFLNRDHTINRSWTGLIGEDDLDEQIEAILNS